MASKRLRPAKLEIASTTNNEGNQNLINGLNNGSTHKENHRKRKTNSDNSDKTPKKSKAIVMKLDENNTEIKNENNNELQSNNTTETNNESNSSNEKIRKRLKSTDSCKFDEINWPNEDINELLEKIQENIPKDDCLMYSTRLDKLDWSKLIFKNYSIDDCKNTWLSIQRNVRKFRLLSEVLDDAKKWLTNSLTNRNQKLLNIPKRPLTAYFIFYQEVKDEIMSENPGLDVIHISKLVSQKYRNLTQAQRDEYIHTAAASREAYNMKMKEFLEQHPDYIPPTSNKLNTKLEKINKAAKTNNTNTNSDNTKTTTTTSNNNSNINNKVQKPPKKTQTPFHLYYSSELSKLNQKVDKLSFKEDCKQQWKSMSNDMKVPWINLAEQNESKYLEELQTYINEHPEYKPDTKPSKSVLSKEEKLIKQRVAGKPEKPPSSAYNLYTKTMLTSSEIKTIQPKDRLNFIANQWKSSTEEERNQYRDTVNSMVEIYKAQYANYLGSLTEEQKQIEINSEKKSKAKPIRVSVGSKTKRSSNKRKSKAVKKKSTNSNNSTSTAATTTTTTKKKKPKKKPKVKEQAPTRVRMEKPLTPPVSPSTYFGTVYTGDDDPIHAWKNLSREERNNYKKELTEKKKAYIIQYEKFLKSLTKEELEEFSKALQNAKPDDDDQSVCSSNSACDFDNDCELEREVCFDSSNCSSDTQ